MRRHYIPFLLCFVAITFFQCQKELSYIGGPDINTNVVTPDPVTAHIQGNVFDETGAPASGVTVKVGNKTTTTNAKGYFRINSAALDKRSALVTAEKAGFFKSFRTFAATSGTNQVVIRMIAKQLTGTVPATTGGEVSLSNGTKVALPANGIVTASGNAAYTGTVNVYMSYIDPSSPVIADLVPGSFMANDKDGNRVSLLSYGMVAVDLEGSAGEKLQIKTGSTATLTTAIPSAALATAPATIPLWSIDETTGLWKEEGVATKNGNVYTGQVSHFSFWNCDAPFPVTYVSMTLKNSAGLPLVHARVKILTNISGWAAAGYGITDSLGQVCGLMPKNSPLVLQVLDDCYNPFFSQNIGPFTGQTNLGVITVNNTGSSVVTLSGKLLNCTGQPVTNGYAVISTGNWVRYAATDAGGNFQTTVMHCGSNSLAYTIIGVDNATTQQGSPVTANMTVPNTATGNITACGVSTTQFINYTIDGNNFTLGGVPGDSLVGYTSIQGMPLMSSIQGARMGTTNSFSVYFNHNTPAPGTYPSIHISAGNVNFGGQTTGPDVVITAFPTTAGLYYEGSVNGSFLDSSAVNHTISATFRVRRQ